MAAVPGRNVNPPIRLAPAGWKTLHQIPNADRIGLAVAVAGDRVGASSGLDKNVRPEDTGRNFHGGDLRDRDAFLGAAEPAPLQPAHAQIVDNDSYREQEIAPGPAAGGERFFAGNRTRRI